MIKELLKKDAAVLTFLFVAGLVAHFALYVDVGFEQMWVWPNPYLYANAFALHYIFGLALGLVVTLRDEVTRTEEFLWHRPVSRQLVFGARMLAGFSIMVSWLVLSLGAHWIIEGWGNPNKLVADGGRVWVYLAYGTLLCSSFAAACFAASWPGHWTLRLTFGATPALLILMACFGQPFTYTDPNQHPATAAVILLLATALLIYASWRNQLAGRDPDHPVETSALKWSVPIAAAAGCVLAAWSLADLQREYSYAVRRWYPEIAPKPDGGYYLRGFNPETWPDVYEYMVFDHQHRVVQPAPGPDSSLPRPWSPRGAFVAPTPALLRPLHAGRMEVGRVSFYVRCFLDPTDGHAQLITTADRRHPHRQPTRLYLAKGPDRKPFSLEATHLGSSWDPLAMVWDRDGIWAYDLNGSADHFHRVSLPDDDRVLDWTTPNRDEARDLRLNEKRLVVLGEKGTYGWTGTEFVRLDPSKVQLSYLIQPRVNVRVDGVDPFVFTAVVPGPDDAIAFRHQYALHCWREKLPAVVVFGVSLLRLPLFQAQSFLRTEGRFSFRAAQLTDPLLAGRKRPWLLGLNLLFTAVLAVLAVGRMRRLQLPRGRTLCWAIAIGLGGLPLYLYYRSTETDRAWRQAPILRPEEIPSMWIRSA